MTNAEQIASHHTTIMRIYRTDRWSLSQIYLFSYFDLIQSNFDDVKK